MPEAPDIINNLLRMTANIVVMQLENIGRDAAIPADEYPYMEIIEALDDASCDLCAMMDGQIIGRDDPDYPIVSQPAHINCRRILAGVGKAEVDPNGDPLEPDYSRPSQDLVDEHGHFMRFPEKYKPLKVISQPEGRDFVARPYVDEHGNKRVRIDWRIEPYELEAA